MDEKLNSTSNEYPLSILLIDPATQKQEIHEKRDADIIITFFQVFLVFGVAGSVKSVKWVLVGCGI